VAIRSLAGPSQTFGPQLSNSESLVFSPQDGSLLSFPCARRSSDNTTLTISTPVQVVTVSESVELENIAAAEAGLAIVDYGL